MTEPLCPEWSAIPKPVIGMLHLPALPGSPGYGGDLDAIRRHVLNDAKALKAGGVHGLMLENFGDVPFFADTVPAHTLTHMTALALAVREAVDLPLGINVLRNDGLAALAIAHAVGASYIRVNVLSGASLTDQGVITGKAAQIMRYRKQISAEHIKVLADVRVKHAAPIAERPLDEEVDELVKRAAADALIVSGTGTGRPTNPAELSAVKRFSSGAPVLVGSGATPQTLPQLSQADGFIVGSGFKAGGDTSRPIDPERVEAFMRAAQAV